MLYIVSQNGFRITDLHAISVITPDHDREDDGVYKVFVNGSEFGRYSEVRTIQNIMSDIKKCISLGRDTYLALPEE